MTVFIRLGDEKICGLIGEFNNNTTFNDKNRGAFISEALLCGVVRGYDSTGLLAVKRNDPDDVFIYKKDVTGPDFIQLKGYHKFLKAIYSYRFIVGHNRWATKGGVSAAAAHPFQHGNISLVHNGTLLWHNNLKTKETYTVDSEAICASINENGAEETIKKLDGAYALVWYDQAKQKMFMVRNEERPLYYATIKDSDTIIFASEYGMLAWLGNRNGYIIKEIHSLDVDTLYEFDKNLETDVVKTEVETYTPYIAPVKAITHINPKKRGWEHAQRVRSEGLEKLGLSVGGHTDVSPMSWNPYNAKDTKGYFSCVSAYGDDAEYKIHGASNTDLEIGMVYSVDVKNFIIRNGKKKKDQVVVENPLDTNLTLDEFVKWCTDDGSVQDAYMNGFTEADDDIAKEFVRGPNGDTIEVKKFLKLTEHGCAQCSGNVLLEDDESMSWTYNNDPICPTCTKENEDDEFAYRHLH